MTDFRKYVIEEHVEDFNDGMISRRELLRRVTLITGSMAGSLALLQVMGCGDGEPAATGLTTRQTTGTATGPVSRDTSAAQPYATPPQQPTADGVTVRPDDPRISVVDIPVTAADGAAMMGYAARPAGGDPAGGVLVVHENRGLTEHIKDVVRRLATAGFTALSIDLLSRQGGAAAMTDPAAYAAELTRREPAGMVDDLARALAALSATGTGDRLGMIGFCFGGGMTWNTVAAGTALKAAVPFYGPAPANLDGLATTKAAVLGLYAERDARITGSSDQVRAALDRGDAPHKVTVYPGVDHAFHNDTGQRYNAAQAEAAWIDTVEWLRQYVR